MSAWLYKEVLYKEVLSVKIWIKKQVTLDTLYFCIEFQVLQMQIQKLCHKPPVNIIIKLVIALKIGKGSCLNIIGFLQSL